MTDTDTAELVAQYRAYIAACSGPGTTLYDGHPAVLMSKGVDRLAALERERDEARALNNKYAWERDKAREERDAAERRSEAFWKPQLTAFQAEVERLKEALKFYRDEFKPKIGKPIPGASSITFHPSEALLEDCGNRAMAALQPQVGK